MKNIYTHIPGFPRVGAQRELKTALERHWRGELAAAELEAEGRALRARHWARQRDAGLDFVTVGDFAFYDHVANHIQLLGCEPARFGFQAETPLERYFTLARGRAGAPRGDCACGHGSANDQNSHDGHDGHDSGSPALEMTKWFDTNYHYLVPELDAATHFELSSTRLFDEVDEALALGHAVKATLIGPLTFLWLARSTDATPRRDLLDCLLPRLLPIYGQVLARLKEQGVAWVQVEEPILGLDLPQEWRSAFDTAYWQLNQAGAPLLLATYFSPLEENLSLACRLPVAGLHVDGVRAAHELVSVADWLPVHKVLSVGIVDGRNIWRTDLDAALGTLAPLLEKRNGQLWLSTSCSLLHVPYSLEVETALDPELASWLAFAHEKLDELAVLKTAIEQPRAAAAALAASRAAIATRRASPRVRDAAVRARLAALPDHAAQRKSPFAERRLLQGAKLNLPPFPTTTIGSFPQTPAIRSARAAFKRGDLDGTGYEAAMRAEIEHAIRRQEALGLDVLVHGEAERNDMVEYFGEHLAGFAFTRNGWVQSYGSRCVKPPVIWGDVSRPAPITVAWARHAQSLTPLPVKGMLTGPVTILQWSFVRDDQPRADTADQIALAMRDEVDDLQQAGIDIVQIDEPALREGLPLRQARRAAYLDRAVRAFRLTAAVARDGTQIHTHMCYAEFNDILPQIAALDADVITIETSRSAMALLDAFGDFRYPNDIGPGVYDIHSPRVPDREEMLALLRRARAVIPAGQLWVNPDCGLKTRGWPETEAALRHMVDAARQMRAEWASEATNAATSAAANAAVNAVASTLTNKVAAEAGSGTAEAA
ncbi:5-methyltetrahydropteroyltriglutamate--homocysteine S-methyltransferase [Pseudoduganella albidiflava]|uniref:5-methyltetrahydropteroyltriglutamate--homocysteine methyltransferase n=1 Tax=Pseudoduganella albidiflava TaxID=321983 RepID=A0A411X5S5_9BURK|nr:5-methyltetrahydropteroyltriglutamate--homocysteine S-methyltransferase [Pseudoduganella albidiflava]QBI04254.1 5-methyltetrahydropteroyltriglutamate--homocysteine S-methyltransferase [Pseudoduganella albidiflava]GGY25826.1 5-methyltetrahydropteroyltriglutamate--homocysteine methyltransferase [Pseudoduganella albidiflava]